jgi:hypothetical protein
MVLEPSSICVQELPELMKVPEVPVIKYSPVVA